MPYGVPMFKVRMLFLTLLSFNCFATEFTHLKFNQDFKVVLENQNLNISVRKNSRSTKSLVQDNSSLNAIRSLFHKAIFGNTSINKDSVISSFPNDGEESTLYAEIRSYLEAAHEEIGRSQVDQINLINQQFNLGTQNFSGFSWQKPFGVIQVFADRQITPNLFSDNWLIQDIFIFEIEAASFLEKLNDAGLLNMGPLEIGAFAGIKFKRVYTNYHYAPTYLAGLSAKFTKLFLPFIQFNYAGMEKLGSDEIMKREDQWTTRAGGLISTPPIYGASLSGGLLGELAFEQATVVQSTPESKLESERYRVGINGKKTSEAQASFSLQLDFYKLLKLTLLNFDLNYEYSSEIENTLVFSKTNWQQLIKDPSKKEELQKIIRGSTSVKLLLPYVAQLDESTSSAVEMRGSVLIWGKMQKSKTEQIKVINDGNMKLFYKTYSQSVRAVQNILSRIFSAVVYKLFKFPVGSTNAALFTKKMILEYEASSPQAMNPEVARIQSISDFSFSLNQSFEASKTDRWIDKKIKNDSIGFTQQFTNLSENHATLLSNNQLKGPLQIESTLRIEKTGFEYFLKAEKNLIWKSIAHTCGVGNTELWMNEGSREKRLQRLLLGKEACVKKLGRAYEHFRMDYLENSSMPSIKKFKDFLGPYFKESKTLSNIYPLFGEQNIFLSGRIQATTAEGNSYVQPFSSGQFRGLGVIDNFKRSNGSRAPASILSE
jgi:hypothetical protein